MKRAPIGVDEGDEAAHSEEDCVNDIEYPQHNRDSADRQALYAASAGATDSAKAVHGLSNYSRDAGDSARVSRVCVLQAGRNSQHPPRSFAAIANTACPCSASYSTVEGKSTNLDFENGASLY